MREKTKRRKLGMGGYQAINPFGKLPAIKVGSQVHQRAQPQLIQYWGIHNTGAKEETQKDISS